MSPKKPRLSDAGSNSVCNKLIIIIVVVVIIISAMNYECQHCHVSSLWSSWEDQDSGLHALVEMLNSFNIALWCYRKCLHVCWRIGNTCCHQITIDISPPLTIAILDLIHPLKSRLCLRQEIYLRPWMWIVRLQCSPTLLLFSMHCIWFMRSHYCLLFICFRFHHRLR